MTNIVILTMYYNVYIYSHGWDYRLEVILQLITSHTHTQHREYYIALSPDPGVSTLQNLFHKVGMFSYLIIGNFTWSRWHNQEWHMAVI